ncbi:MULTISPECIES: hypothetical protein [unclassified Nocardioides]|uniref:hypothetical protein n=1 Tax=unclassified Nocardioides TaxID=2615069 RepID=UPI0006FD5DD8|nr:MULTISPECIES: hypothetical protein [unclassified Nocardioides]KQY57007.1 hypothetical protein ASD30_12135 [Nocardioides sp. Root140]KRF13131.1 hypothetical protein ASH02_16780 [Nocardioides sp. Soil796]
MNDATGRLAALYSDPARERRLGIRFMLAAIVMFAIAALGVFSLVQGSSVARALVWIVIGGLVGALCALLALNNFMLSRRTGEGLLTVAVGQDGLVGPELIGLPWSQITQVTDTVHGESKRGRTPRSLTVRVRDHDALLATVPEKVRWLVDRGENGAAHVTTGLGAVTDDEYRGFLDVLRTELDRRQIPLVDARD